MTFRAGVTIMLIGLALAIFAAWALARPAHAHDLWADGSVVPAWVKAACCGPTDVHHLTPAQVHARRDGWHIDGYGAAVPYGKELPSQDGDYWAFYANLSDGSQSPMYCFFTPAQGA